MMDLIYFTGSAALGIVGWATIFAAIAWPKMKRQPRTQQTEDPHGDPLLPLRAAGRR
jgi:hypothetical protein